MSVIDEELAKAFLDDPDNVNLLEATAITDDAAELLSQHEGEINLCDCSRISEKANPLSPPSAPVQMRLQSPPAKSKFLAVIDEAEEKKFVSKEKRKPPTGRPSQWVILPRSPWRHGSLTTSNPY